MNNSFSKMVRQQRIKLRINQTELAETLGYKSYVSIVRIETHNYIPEHAIIVRLAKELRLPLDDLLDAASEQLETSSDICSIIRRARIKMNLSQKEISLDLGYKSQASYSRIERGEKILSYEEIILLSRLLKIPQSVLEKAS